MYGIFTHIYHTNQPNVGKIYQSHGCFFFLNVQDFTIFSKRVLYFTCQAQLEERGRKIEEMGSPSARTVHHGWIQPGISVDFECDSSAMRFKNGYVYNVDDIFCTSSPVFWFTFQNGSGIDTPNPMNFAGQFWRLIFFPRGDVEKLRLEAHHLRANRVEDRSDEQLTSRYPTGSWDQLVLQKLSSIYR